MLNYCPLQRDVACLVAGIPFVNTGIPKAIANAIGKKFNDLLQETDPPLSPLFKELDYVPPIDCKDIGCDGQSSALDQAYQRLEQALQQKYGFWGTARIMDAMLAMSRNLGFGEHEGLTAAEVDKLTELLLLYEVSPAEMELIAAIMQEQIREGSAVRRATVDEFGDAIKRHRESLASGPSRESMTSGTPQEGAQGGTAATGDGGEGATAGEIIVPASEKIPVGKYKSTNLRFQVDSGVTRGQYQGDIIKVHLKALIKGTVVTLKGVEVVVVKRVFIPNQANPEKIVVHLQVTKDQHFNIKEINGAEAVKRIGYPSLIYKQGARLSYPLELAGKAE